MTKEALKFELNQALDRRVQDMDWAGVKTALDNRGFTVIHNLISIDQCQGLAALYAEEMRFRHRVVMDRHGFGRGEYKYFCYPLPGLVGALRSTLYRHLSPIANSWNDKLKVPVRYPSEHSEYLAHCHRMGQTRPTPLLLSYGVDDYNCLHQDLYGSEVFPLQVAVLLSQPGEDFSGGEFVLTEQRPRMQSRVEVVPLAQGDAIVFAVCHRPVHGSRGVYRVSLRHGISRVRDGHRRTLGIIFHDAA